MGWGTLRGHGDQCYYTVRANGLRQQVLFVYLFVRTGLVRFSQARLLKQLYRWLVVLTVSLDHQLWAIIRSISLAMKRHYSRTLECWLERVV
jgi:hypothetical protein